MHVKLADESVCIGPHNPINSYLNIPNLVSARDTGADAIHLVMVLSENFKFANTLEQHKIKFIGPRADVIKKMGDKFRAKKIAEELGLPIIKVQRCSNRFGRGKKNFQRNRLSSSN